MVCCINIVCVQVHINMRVAVPDIVRVMARLVIVNIPNVIVRAIIHGAEVLAYVVVILSIVVVVQDIVQAVEQRVEESIRVVIALLITVGVAVRVLIRIVMCVRADIKNLIRE